MSRRTVLLPAVLAAAVAAVSVADPICRLSCGGEASAAAIAVHASAGSSCHGELPEGAGSPRTDTGAGCGRGGNACTIAPVVLAPSAAPPAPAPIAFPPEASPPRAAPAARLAAVASSPPGASPGGTARPSVLRL